MKKNGFMLAEVLIVSTLFIGVMVFMYTQIRTLTLNYTRSFNYNTVDGLYGARVIKDFLMNENTYKNFDSTTFVESNKINRKDLFNALVTELGINKIIVTNNTTLVYDYLTNNYSKASSYTGDTSYYEDFITFTVTLKEDKSKHIIVAYNDGTYADYKF